jgi:predicted kinase
LRSADGAQLGEVYSFVSGLYFRGKLAYARAFGKAPPALSGALVISPCEGLRFPEEQVTAERLESWRYVDIDENEPRFTEPLVAHVRALDAGWGAAARWVLLGSVASDKYVLPLTSVLGERLLFPADFVGRGDMSRGSLALRAARAQSELRYVPVLGSERHGVRPARRAGSEPPTPSVAIRREVPDRVAESLELILFIGLPGAGKSTFFAEHFAATHVHLNKDDLRSRKAPARRHAELLEQALGGLRSVVVDDTNVRAADRAELITAAHRHGARVLGYYFEASPHSCAVRNRQREGRARVPDAAIFSAAKRLEVPALAEGFDELYVVHSLPEGAFEVAGTARSRDNQ